jgi:hypothetical protein
MKAVIASVPVLLSRRKVRLGSRVVLNGVPIQKSLLLQRQQTSLYGQNCPQGEKVAMELLLLQIPCQCQIYEYRVVLCKNTLFGLAL